MADIEKALGMLSMLTENSGEKKAESEEKDDEGDGINPEKLFAIMSVLGSLNEKDERADLLYALKPYLSNKRAENVDMAVKLLTFSKLPKLLKEISS